MTSRKNSKSRTKAKPASKRSGKAKTSKGPAKKKVARKKAASKTRARSKRRSVSAAAEVKREFQSRNRRSGLRSSSQSKDFAGLSRAEQADSESVDELVEEGNVFEAGAVAGVEQADDSDEREVQAHELPEDDVPAEYLDKD